MRLAFLGLLTLAALSACGGSLYPECIGALRYHDHIYREIGFTDHKGTVLKESAEFASCDVVNRDGISEALRKGTEPVKARSLPGYPVEQVVEVQVTDGAWSVLVSEEAPAQLAQQIRGTGLLNAGQQ
jgi:hypothetical protein